MSKLNQNHCVPTTVLELRYCVIVEETVEEEIMV